MNSCCKIVFALLVITQCSFAGEYELKSRSELLNERLLTQYGQNELNKAYIRFIKAQKKLKEVIKIAEEIQETNGNQ